MGNDWVIQWEGRENGWEWSLEQRELQATKQLLSPRVTVQCIHYWTMNSVRCACRRIDAFPMVNFLNKRFSAWTMEILSIVNLPFPCAIVASLLQRCWPTPVLWWLHGWLHVQWSLKIEWSLKLFWVCWRMIFSFPNSTAHLFMETLNGFF